MKTDITVIGMITFAVMLSALITLDAIAFADKADKEMNSAVLESPDEIQECAWEKNLLSEHPHSRYALCELQQCEEPPSTVKERTRAQIAEQKVILENDYIVQQFLRKHPEAALEGAPLHIVNNQRPITWQITTLHDSEPAKETEDFRHDLKNSILPPKKIGKMYVNFDHCSNITEYSYDVTYRDDDDIRAKYPYDDNNLEKIATFEEERYILAKVIIGKHMPPRIQINEFNMQPDKIRCNDGLERIFKHGNSPACVTSETKEKLIERWWTTETKPNTLSIESNSFAPKWTHQIEGKKLTLSQNAMFF